MNLSAHDFIHLGASWHMTLDLMMFRMINLCKTKEGITEEIMRNSSYVIWQQVIFNIKGFVENIWIQISKIFVNF